MIEKKIQLKEMTLFSLKSSMNVDPDEQQANYVEGRCSLSCQTFVAWWKTMNNSLYATCGCEMGRENGKSIMCSPDQTALRALYDHPD